MLRLSVANYPGYLESYYVYNENDNFIGMVVGYDWGFGIYYQSFKGNSNKNLWLHCVDLHTTKEAAAEHLIGNIVDNISKDTLSEQYIEWLEKKE